MNSIFIAVFLVIIAFFSWFALGFVREWLSLKGIVDSPNHRTIHSGEVPRGGGIVFVCIILLAIAVLAFVSQRYLLLGTLFILISSWAMLSWWDDFNDLTALKRLVLQSLFAFMTIFAFGYITAIQVNVTTYVHIGIFGAVLTFIGVLWVTNLFNFMDGMDGLAASQAIVALLSLAFWFFQADDMELMFLCLIAAASCYGFLIRNWHPAQLFMGDVGSIALGALLVTLFIYGNTRYQIPIISFVLLIGVFVFDASVTILRRLVAGEKIWTAHNQHYYQRLAKAGLNHSHIVLINNVLMLCCAMLASVSLIDRDRIVLYVVLELSLMLAYALFVRLKAKKV